MRIKAGKHPPTPRFIERFTLSESADALHCNRCGHFTAVAEKGLSYVHTGSGRCREELVPCDKDSAIERLVSLSNEEG